ncbi:MAG: hypothetical protein H0U27_01330 [Nitrosopumilus sp.]|nr:hypothetical protein [Nitrosopumilus sp.]
MKKRIIYITITALILIIGVASFLFKPLNLHGEDCGTVFDREGNKSTSSQKEKSIDCMKNSLETCKPAFMSFKRFDLEGQENNKYFQIKTKDNNCRIEMYTNFSGKVNSCSGIEKVQYISTSTNQVFYNAVMQGCSNQRDFTEILSYKVEELE